MKPILIISLVIFSLSIFAGEGASSGGPDKSLLILNQNDFLTPKQLFKKHIMQDQSWKKIINNKKKYRVVFPPVRIANTGMSVSADNFCVDGSTVTADRFKQICTNYKDFDKDERTPECTNEITVSVETSVYYDYEKCIQEKKYGKKKEKTKCLKKKRYSFDHSMPKLASIYKKVLRKKEKKLVFYKTKQFIIPDCE